MNDIKIFEKEEFGRIRTAGTSDKPLFCLADICRVLGIANISDVKNRLKNDGVDLIEVIDSLGRKQNAYFINEQNLYRVIMRSDKPIAESFQDWVCGEVLPSIRKTGMYGTPRTFAEALRLAADQQEKIEEQERLIQEQKPKKDGYVFRDKKNKIKPYAKYIKDLFDIKDWGNENTAGLQTMVTPRGKETFRMLYCPLGR